MVRRSIDAARAAEEDAAKTEVVTGREVLRIRRTLEALGDARCPVCRAMLIARQGRAGPYFFCRCPRSQVKRAL